MKNYWTGVNMKTRVVKSDCNIVFKYIPQVYNEKIEKWFGWSDISGWRVFDKEFSKGFLTLKGAKGFLSKKYKNDPLSYKSEIVYEGEEND